MLNLISENCRVLKKLAFSGRRITEVGMESFIEKKSKQMKSLKLKGTYKIPESSFELLSKNSQNLSEVWLNSLDRRALPILKNKILVGNLTKLKLVNSNLLVQDDVLEMLSHARKLVHLDLKSTSSWSNLSFQKLSSLKNLTYLILQKCSHISDSAIIPVLESNRNLRRLNIMNCIFLTFFLIDL